MSSSNISDISVDRLFNGDAIYEIPIYQRNYAWRAEQIETLLDDIEGNENATYYLGTLVVSKKRGEDNKYEVIDGQQRLTTLFLLFKVLKEASEEALQKASKDNQEQSQAEKSESDDLFNDSCLRFEARDISDRLLRDPGADISAEEGHEISEGYKIIEHWLQYRYSFNPDQDSGKEGKLPIKDFIEKLKKTMILRLPVPEHTDLNHYFEIMNTRGEQLELHEIAKGRLIAALDGKPCDKEEKAKRKNIAAKIWDACSDMSRYIQTFQVEDDEEDGVKKDVQGIRNALFGENWNSFPCKDFDAIVKRWPENSGSISKDNDPAYSLETVEEDLEGFLPEEQGKKNSKLDDEESKKGKYESIIRFPHLLLHVNLVLLNKENGREDDDKGDERDLERKLDDKALLVNLKDHWSTTEKAENFIYNLLKYRYYFDKYIIKRDYSGDGEDGEWSLRKWEKYENKNKVSWSESNLVSDKKLNRQLLTLESCCRITYTSPGAMYWITRVLKEIPDDEALKEADVARKLIKVLEGYCVGKLKEAKNKVPGQEKELHPFGKGFDIPRIVFSYLDYLLYRDGYEGKKIVTEQGRGGFDFKFRNSIEHFYPQNPENGTRLKPEEVLDNFGNLALITVSGNSRVSNFLPQVKAKQWAGSVISQSLKLQVMADIAKDEDWGEKQIKEHNEKMLDILENAIKEQSISQQEE